MGSIPITVIGLTDGAKPKEKAAGLLSLRGLGRKGWTLRQSRSLA